MSASYSSLKKTKLISMLRPLFVLVVASSSSLAKPSKRCLKGTLDCLDPYESQLPRVWQVATPPGVPGNTTMAMLDSLLEMVSFAIEEKHDRRPAFILRDRVWWGMGMIGNKFAQAHGYFALVQAEARRKAPAGLTICEVGLNGGHSAVVFLQAAGRQSRLYMFDVPMPYAKTAQKIIERLYPGQMEYLEGDSRVTSAEAHTPLLVCTLLTMVCALCVLQVTTPKFAREHGQICDVMSIDGNHHADAVMQDLHAARRMSRPGALLVLDDMVTHRDDMGRPGVERFAISGGLTGLECTPDLVMAIPEKHRFDYSRSVKYVAHAWCHARFAM